MGRAAKLVQISCFVSGLQLSHSFRLFRQENGNDFLQELTIAARCRQGINFIKQQVLIEV